jgi:sugar phosphate isomerase/epimerase
MKFMVCAYGLPGELPYLPRVETLKVGVELQSYGLEGVSSPESWAEKLSQHREVSKRFKGDLAIHGPFLGIAYDYKDHLLKDAVQKRLDLIYQVVMDIKPRTLVLHTGYTEEVEKFHLDDSWLESTVTFWKTEIKRYASERITVVLENLLEPEPDQMNTLIDRVDNPYLKLCFDIGHANIWSHLTPSEWVEKMGSRLAHVHLHDNHDDIDEHLPVGEGNIDFAPFFDTLYKVVPDVTVSLEVDAARETVISNLLMVLDQYRKVS